MRVRDAVRRACLTMCTNVFKRSVTCVYSSVKCVCVLVFVVALRFWGRSPGLLILLPSRKCVLCVGVVCACGVWVWVSRCVSERECVCT